MRVGSISQSFQTQYRPCTFNSSKFPEYQSTLEGVGEFARKKRDSFISRAIAFIKDGFSRVVTWIASWIPRRAKRIQKYKEIDYFRVLSSGNGKAKYRLVRDGKGTGSEINFSQKYVILDEISFPSKEDRLKLPEMVSLIMEEEKIDCIRTTNLFRAKILWDCGLKTESFLVFKPERQDPLNKLLKKVIQEAFKQKAYLDDDALEVLHRIEESIIRGIVSDAVSFNRDANHTALHQSIASTSQKAFSQIFNPSFAVGQIKKMEQILGYSFNLKALAKEASKNDDLNYASALKKIVEFKGNVPVVASGEEIELGFLLGDLFTLMDATETSMDIPIVQEFPHLIFSKKEQGCV